MALQRNARHSTAGDITVTALVTGLPIGLQDFTSAEFWQFVEEREEKEEEDHHQQ